MKIKSPTNRLLHKNRRRPVRASMKGKYAYHQHSWTDEAFEIIPFTGTMDKQQDKSKLHKALRIFLGQECTSGYMGHSWNIERIFQFSNSGVVVVRHVYNIGD